MCPVTRQISQACSFSRGATLALYTDGLVESRVRTLDEGISALGDALSVSLAPAGAALGRACAAATEALSRHGEDDSTLVLARLGLPGHCAAAR